MRYCGDFNKVAPGCLIDLAPEAFTELNKALSRLQTANPKRAPFLEFLGLAASFRGDGGHAIASLALPEARIKKLVEFAGSWCSKVLRLWRRFRGSRGGYLLRQQPLWADLSGLRLSQSTGLSRRGEELCRAMPKAASYGGLRCSPQ